jgi:hypothetical protein
MPHRVIEYFFATGAQTKIEARRSAEDAICSPRTLAKVKIVLRREISRSRFASR